MIATQGLTAIEVAAGFAIGGSVAQRAQALRSRESPLEALTAAVEPRLRAGRCAVAFSGGRDSSLVLAAAVRAARRTGAPLPAALTVRYPHLAETDESHWQELVVRHLGVEDWIRVDVEHDLDLVGPVARPLLRRCGPLYPANGHALVPLLEAARGANLLLGIGGDELLMTRRRQALMDLLGRRRRPERGDLRRIAGALVPRALRRRLVRGGDSLMAPQLTWLTPEARDRVARAERSALDEPLRWQAAVADAAGRRSLVLTADCLRSIGAAEGVSVDMPLLDPRFVSAVGHAGGLTGWGSRSAAMRAIAGDSLPAELLARRDKAVFNRSFFGRDSRAFAESWGGEGVDRRLVDPGRVRDAWREPNPDFRTAMLLQSAWTAATAA
jgi:asparagine synthetase B (glutamine-hydrolysing)